MGPDEVMLFYSDARTSDGRGVTGPSQRRYVQYFHTWLTEYVSVVLLTVVNSVMMEFYSCSFCLSPERRAFNFSGTLLVVESVELVRIRVY